MTGWLGSRRLPSFPVPPATVWGALEDGHALAAPALGDNVRDDVAFVECELEPPPLNTVRDYARLGAGVESYRLAILNRQCGLTGTRYAREKDHADHCAACNAQGCWTVPS